METEAASTIRILIVDDHLAMRIGLTSMLESQCGFTVAGAASSGEEALAMLARDVPDVLLVDLRMRQMDGIALLREVERRQYPLRAIVFSSYELDEDIYKAVNAGAQGYLLKDASEQGLVDAIQMVHAGHSYFPRHIASRLTQRLRRSSLSAREIEVLELMAKGLTNKQIAQVLDISSHTVRCHVARITEKLEVADRTEAVTMALSYGVIQIA